VSVRPLTFSSASFAGSPSAAATPECDVLFVGEAVDDRGSVALGAFQQRAKKVVQLGYESQKLLVDGQESSLRDLKTILGKSKRVIFEATTLGMAEVLRGLQAVKELGLDEVQFLYVEPRFYNKVEPLIDGVLSPREFELTQNNRFVSLQGFAQEFAEEQISHHVCFLGYESSRIQQAFEQRGEYSEKTYHRFFIVGIPAFAPGWETNVLANHAQILKRMNLSGNAIKYCAANSIREAYLLLGELYRSIATETSVFWVSPLGTKPHTIAAALFLLETKGNSQSTSLFYDHPKRTSKRSGDVARYHLVGVKGLQAT
jgi:hypothetical protein